METPHEELGDIAEIEASEEHLQHFTTLYTEKITGDERDEPASANDDEDDSQEDFDNEDDGSPYVPRDPDCYQGERL